MDERNNRPDDGGPAAPGGPDGASPAGPPGGDGAAPPTPTTAAATRRRRWPLVLLAAFVALLLALSAGGAWLLGTQAGLDRVLALVRHVGPVSIEAEGARGRLIGRLHIDRLVIDHERVHVVAEGIDVDPSVLGLPFLEIAIDTAKVASVDLQLKARTKPPDDLPPRFLPGPLRLAVERFDVGRFTLHTPGGTTTEIRAIGGTLAMSRTTLTVTGASADGGAWAARGEAELRAADPLQLAATGAWEVRAADKRYVGTGRASGDLENLAVVATATMPRGVAFDGRLHLADGFSVDGRATLDGFDPADVGAGRAFGPVSGALDVAGGLDAFKATGRLQAPTLKTGPLDLALDGGYADRTFTVRSLALAKPATDLRVTASGAVDLHEAPRIRFAGDWTALRWPLSGAPLVVLPRGRYTIEGAGTYAYTVDASVRGPAIPPSEVQARGDVDANRLRVASVDARTLRGRVTGTAELAWQGEQPWSAKLDGRGLDFGVLRPQLKGRVNAAVEANGRGFEPTGWWDARIARLDGNVRGLPARGRGSAQMRAGQLRVNGLEVFFGSAQLQADGTVGRKSSDLEWRLRLDDLGSFLPDASGSLRSRGTIVGTDGRTAVQGTIGARNLKYGEWQAAQVVADVDVDTTDRDASYLKIVALRAGQATRYADQVRITLDGRASDHALVVRGTSGQDWMELVTRGRFDAKTSTWTVDLQDFRVQGPPLLSYRLESPSNLVANRDGVLLSTTCFVREVERICAAGTWSAATAWAMTLNARDMPLRLLPLALPRGTEYAGSVDVDATVRGAPRELWTAEAGLGFRDAEFRYRVPSGRMEVVRLGTGRVEARAAPESYLAHVGLATVAGSSIEGHAELRRSDTPIVDLPLTGQLAMETRELAWLPLFVPEVDRLTGHLVTKVDLGGTAGSPELRGFVAFDGGEIDVYRTNLLLRDVNARIALDANRIGLDATATTRGGSAKARGALEWRDRVPFGTLNFTGENLLVADLPEAKVTASPNLDFRIDGRRMDIGGEVRIPMARIQPKDLRGAVLPSGDEKIVGTGTPDERAGAFVVNTSVRLTLGDDVKIDAYGLKGRLGGNLLVTARPNEVPIGSGELTIRDGTFEAYTRALDIDRGRLLFAGQAVGNPGLDIRAQRKIVNTRTGGDIVAGINVRGTLLKPQLSFYSDPSMSQSQIASMIIVGRTLDDLQDSQRQTLGSADTRTALTAQGSAFLAGQLGRYVGIDDVAVEQGANNSTSVVIGKFLSPRLYVSYGVSLTETINTLKLRYTIGDRWVIKTESGVRQSADIEYTIER
jgi:translocation and assembly module TamB